MTIAVDLGRKATKPTNQPTDGGKEVLFLPTKEMLNLVLHRHNISVTCIKMFKKIREDT